MILSVVRVLVIIASVTVLFAIVMANLPGTTFSVSLGETMQWICEFFSATPAADAAAEPSNLCEILFLIGLPALFGGVLAVLQVIANLTGLAFDDRKLSDGGYQSIKELSKNKPLGIWLTIGALGGLGGGLAMLAAMSLNGKFDDQLRDKDRLLFIGVGLLSGYVGLRLIRRISNQLFDEMGDMQRKLGDDQKQLNKETTDLRKKLVDGAAEFQSTMMRVKIIAASDVGFYVANSLDDDHHVEQIAVRNAVDRLEGALDEEPSNRRCGIVLARIRRREDQVGRPATKNKDEKKKQEIAGMRKAIEVLNRVIDKRLELGLTKDEQESADTAAVLYNRSCYRAMIYDRQTPGSESEKTNCLTDLERAARLDLTIPGDAHKDEDFNSVRDDSRFTQICG